MARHFQVFTKITEKQERPFMKEDASGPEPFPQEIPILLDDVKTYEEFEMTRCTYFSIECDLPSLDWRLEIEESAISFFLVGLSGIITKPMGDHFIFDSVGLIDELFDLIESHPSLYVDTNDLWLPNFLFVEKQTRGQVYRIGVRLFNEAYYFREERIGKERFLAVCKEFSGQIRESGEETAAFKTWEAQEIRKAMDLYPKDRESALKWSE